MGLETLALIGIGAAAAAAGTSVGVSAAQARDAEKRQKGIAEDAQNAAKEKELEIKMAAEKAEQQAREQLIKKRQSMTQTILTSPIGISGAAPTLKTTLGSAGV